MNKICGQSSVIPDGERNVHGWTAQQLVRIILLKRRIAAHYRNLRTRGVTDAYLPRAGIFSLGECDELLPSSSAFHEMSIALYGGLPYVVLHIDPVPLEQRTIAVLRQSLEKVAQYLMRGGDGFEPIGVVGITYPRLGQIAQRLGFTVAVLPPDRFTTVAQMSIKRHARRHARKLRQSADGDIALCYMETRQFVRMFAKSKP